MSNTDRLRAAVESAPSGLVMTDAEGRIVLLNREVERLFGYDREELLGQEVEILVPQRFRRGHPKDRGAFLRSPSVRAMGHGRDLYGLRKDGSEIPIEIGLTPVATVEGLFVVASIVDISARRQAEEERRLLLTQLQEAQRAAVIGTLAGGVAHDFNNLLGSIIGYAELARAKVRRPETRSDLDALLTAAEHGRRIVDRILRFVRRDRPEPKVMDLGDTIREAVRLLRGALPSSIELVPELPATPLPLNGDATAVHQVLMNLATNAANAMPEGGRLVVTLESVYITDSARRRHPGLGEGPHAALAVRDTGAGMTPEVREHAFDPFFTTRAPGTGSGLGLAMVRQIVEEHHGAVELESAPGAGTTVRVFLPLAADQAESGSHGALVEIPRGSGQRLLYVDDEPMLRDVVGRRIVALGYAVTTAADGPEAIAMLEADPTAFDVVLTDFTMPRMNGIDLARRLTAIRAGLPIILVSGTADIVSEAALAAAGVRRRIQKPLTLEQLASILREVLAGA